MWCNILFLFVIDLLIIKTNAVNVCTNESVVSTDVTLNLLNGTGVSGCNCNVRLENPDKITSGIPQIIFKAVKFSGCKYKLVIPYNNASPSFNCSYNNTILHNINKTDEIQLYLESASSQDDTTFEVKITSSVTTSGDLFIRLDCFLPHTNTSTTNATDIQTPVTELNSTAISSTTSVSDITEASITTVTMDSSWKVPDIRIIGGAAGGGLLLVIVIIICVCIMWRKKKKERGNYDRPAVRELGPGYSEVNIIQQGKNNNSSQEMEIIENDLYISSGDVMHSISRDDEDTNQKPDNEYAVVKKDRKPTNTTLKDVGHSNSSIAPNIDRKFVIGPQGDKYTLVELK